MENETPKRRGRPPKNLPAAAKPPEEKTSAQPKSRSHEFAASTKMYSMDASYSLNFISEKRYDADTIRRWLANPQDYIEDLRELAWWAYHAIGSINTAEEYMRTMHTLDGVAACKTRKTDGSFPRNHLKNSKLMTATLRTIRYKALIRDFLLRLMNDGMAVDYFETASAAPPTTKILSDVDIAGITEINEAGTNAAVISLPIEHCRIVGRKNGTPLVAFNLRYFTTMTPSERKRALNGFPKEIREGYARCVEGEEHLGWLILDSEATICAKICAEEKAPFGVPFPVKAIEDALYEKKYMDTKRAVLDDVLTEIFYQILPEGKDKGSNALTKEQQETLHKNVRGAILGDRAVRGKRVVTLPPNTKLDKIKVDTGLLSDDAETNIKENVPSALGLAAALISNAQSNTYATAALNAEFVAAYVFSWIELFMAELNKAINAKIIKDRSCVVDFEILPITYVNRDKSFTYMKQLYLECGGSLSAVVAASGMNVETYLALMDFERAQKYDERYPPHVTSYTVSGSEKKALPYQYTGKEQSPTTDLSNPSSISTVENDGNRSPKPST